MNDRIRQLAEQAGCESLLAEHRLEEFAKLLIEDCLKVLDDTAAKSCREGTYMGDDVPTSAHQNEIRRHFGLV